MSTVLEAEFLSVEDYLSGEESSSMRHEYIGGMVYAMASGSDAHNLISGNFFGELRSRPRGGPCRVFISDLKVRLCLAGKDIFYYPDVMVTCDPRDTEAYFKQFPKVLIEVLSDTTEGTDRREKFWNYTQIETLEEYVLAAQNKMEVTIFRRSNEWKPEILRLPEQQMRLNSLNFNLPPATPANSPARLHIPDKREYPVAPKRQNPGVFPLHSCLRPACPEHPSPECGNAECTGARHTAPDRT